MDCDGKSDSSPEREPNDEELKSSEGLDGMKKRKRKPYRPGEEMGKGKCRGREGGREGGRGSKAVKERV